MSKLVTLAAAATGYVLGARAGRPRYEQIASTARKVWGDPRVQQGVAQAQQAAERQAPVVKDKVTDAVGKVSDKVSDRSSGSGKSSGSTSKTTASSGGGTSKA